MKIHFTHRIKKLLIAMSIGFIGLGASGSVLASEEANEGHPEMFGHHHPDHALGVFLGGTTTEESSEFTFGLEYEYRLTKHIGIGIVGEHTPDAAAFTQGATTALALVHLHPYRGLSLIAGIGAEIGHGSELEEELEFEEGVARRRIVGVEPEAEIVYRLGVAYDVHLSKTFSIAPSVNVDFVNGEENVVFGGIFMYHF